jgi:3'-5' exoribonuclease
MGGGRREIIISGAFLGGLLAFFAVCAVMTQKTFLTTLGELAPGQEADFFALLAAKEELTTRDQKPYFKVTFRDASRQVAFPIWGDSPWAAECKQSWSAGTCYKLRALYRETSYGPQLEIRKIRPVNDQDAADGFDPLAFLPQSRHSPLKMFDELRGIAVDHIAETVLRELTLDLLDGHRTELLALPAATRNHHAFVGGWLEHVLGVTHNALWLAERYQSMYPDLQPPLNKDLVVAGAILHDIGKLQEIAWNATGAEYTASGNLIGHMLQGRDIVRDAARAKKLPGDMLLRLEHIIISHQRLPEWGSPKQPMTPEALLVHYADDIDAKFQMMYVALRDDATPGPMTSKRNTLYQRVYRGEEK